jgi:hypothetical protein
MLAGGSVAVEVQVKVEVEVGALAAVLGTAWL